MKVIARSMKEAQHALNDIFPGDEIEIVCPKCKAESGDDWSQCDKDCPMEMSPHFNIVTHAAFDAPKQRN
jgi:hypothetical protein